VLRGAALRRNDLRVNWLQGALRLADLRVTVSPTYAEEVMGGGSAGAGLTDVVRASGGLAGIVNGVDAAEWDPATDAHLPGGGRFSNPADVHAGKRVCKALLQRELGLVVSDQEPLICFIGRLEDQKGVDLVLAGLPEFMAPKPAPAPREPGAPPRVPDADDPYLRTALGAADGLPYQPSGLMRKAMELLAQVHREHLVLTNPLPSTGRDRSGREFVHPQLVMLGTGKGWLETALRDLDKSYPARAVGLPKFDVRLSHLLLAASDYCVIPSRFEPCGLVAQCAMRYGSIPIATATGGMRDFIPASASYLIPALARDGEPECLEDSVGRLVSTVQGALAEYGTERFRHKREECMVQDVTWKGPGEVWGAMLSGLSWGLSRS